MNLDLPLGLKLGVGWLTGACGQLVGGWDLPLYLLMLVNVADILFGIAAGCKTEGFKSKKLATGTARKVGYWGVVVIAYAVDQALAYYGLTDKNWIHEATIISFFVADGVSALANAATCNVPIPQPLLEGLAKLKALTVPTEKPRNV